MTTLIKIDGEYANWIKDLSLRFRQSQIKAVSNPNSQFQSYKFIFHIFKQSCAFIGL